MLTNFKANTSYSTRSTGTFHVVKVSAKSIVITGSMIDGEKRVKIHNTGDADFAFPNGRYSMAQTISADRPSQL